MVKDATVNPACLQYAQHHLLMLVLLLLFFGVLIVPRFYEQLQYQQLQKTEGLIKSIYYSNSSSPSLSFVEISYEWDGKKYVVQETLPQNVKVGDQIEIYIDPRKNHSIQLQKPDAYVPSVLLLSYFVIVGFCLFKLYGFFMYKK